MTVKRRPPRRRRIVVALGGRGATEDLLEVMAELAQSMEAELAGLFVEDINLLRLAGLPFARAFSHHEAAERPIEAAAMERELRAQARAAERALAAVAARTGVPWSFHVARGLIEAALIEAAREADLLALASAHRALLGREELRLVAQETTHVWERRIGVRRTPAEAGPVAVVFGRSSTAPRVLEAAARLARRDGRPLLVFLVATSEENAAKLKTGAEKLLEGQPGVRYRKLIAPGIGGLIEAIRIARPCGLVLDAGKEMLEPSAIQALQESLTCPVLLVL